MDKEEMKKYCEEQIEQIKKHKWIESEKSGRDLGQEAVADWIRKYGAIFRREWEEKKGQK